MDWLGTLPRQHRNGVSQFRKYLYPSDHVMVQTRSTDSMLTVAIDSSANLVLDHIVYNSRGSSESGHSSYRIRGLGI